MTTSERSAELAVGWIEEVIASGDRAAVWFEIRVVDTETGSKRTYHNPPGEICGRADTAAFRRGPGGRRSSKT